MFKALLKSLTILLVLLSGCGYHAIQPEDKATISIPYVEGDQQGQLTAEIIRQLQQTGLYDFVREGGDYVLKVVIVGDQHETIGYRYDRKEISGNIEKNLMATENRRSLTAQITLTDVATEKTALGPLNVTASGEYDYIDVNSLRELSFINTQGKREKVIAYSLGQLDSVEGAQDNVLAPAYRQLAREIVGMIEKNLIQSSDD